MSTTVFTDINTHIGANAQTERSLRSTLFGQKLGLMTRLFGCRHANLSRPFSNGKAGYRSCINCGSRRAFDPETLETYGAFYAAPAAGRAEHF